nr:hypothetical protein [Tissierella sp.]
MKVWDIKLKDEEGSVNHLRRTIIDREDGMFGQASKADKKNKKRQVSILSKKARETIDQEQLGGLCLFRFYENITIEGLDARAIKKGDLLQIGETLQQVESVGKKCFEECKLVQAEKKCQLFNNVIFMRVLKGGFIEIDDEVKIVEG